MASDYVSINVRRPTHRTLQALQLRLSADLERRLSIDDVIAAALVLVERHRTEAVAALTPD